MTSLGRFLVLMARGINTDAYACPDWYVAAQEAKWLGVPMPEIVTVPLWWREKARIGMAAEAEAQKTLDNLNK